MLRWQAIIPELFATKISALCQAVIAACKAESIWQYLGDRKDFRVKCLCNLNQQDMQVEGCKVTPILSPRVHQFISQTGDRKKALLLEIQT